MPIFAISPQMVLLLTA